MSLLQSVLTMLFCMTVVFCVLIVLWGMIRLFAYVIRLFEARAINTANLSTNKEETN